MKNRILLCLILATSIGIKAQELNTISVPGIKALADGWYKFASQGAEYDVEVSYGTLVKGNVGWFDESTYSGDLSKNVISGKGTYMWPNGDRYEGSFKNNQRSGKGTMHWKNGAKYEGKWKNNKRHGKGKMWQADGSLEEGVWEEGVLVKKK